MLAYVNGQYVPVERPAITVGDRSFRYGDGLFETIRIANGRPFLWKEHIARLRRGAAFLRIPLDLSTGELEFACRHLLAQNDCPEGMIRIHLSRGEGPRGYSFREATVPLVIITTHKSLHTRHAGLKLITSKYRVLADDPLTQHKTANRLANIMARDEADEVGADEAILLNHRGEVAEASAANIFIVREGKVSTPPLSAGALAGTVREFILNNAFQCDVQASEAALTPEDLRQADAVFVTSSHWLVTPVISIDGQSLGALVASDKNSPPHPVVAKVRAFCEAA